MEKIINPTTARTNLFSLIKNANRDSQPVIIAGANDSRSAVLIGKKDYDALQETMNLMMNGQIQATLSRKDDESVDLDEMIKEIDHE
jgi:prevent-host-death family protein